MTLKWVLSFSFSILEVCVCVCVAVVSAWLHHGVVRSKLPALSSNVTNRASRTHSVTRSTGLSWLRVCWSNETTTAMQTVSFSCQVISMVIPVWFPLCLFFLLSYWIVSRWVLSGVVHAVRPSRSVGEWCDSVGHQSEWRDVCLCVGPPAGGGVFNGASPPSAASGVFAGVPQEEAGRRPRLWANRRLVAGRHPHPALLPLQPRLPPPPLPSADAADGLPAQLLLLLGARLLRPAERGGQSSRPPELVSAAQRPGQQQPVVRSPHDDLVSTRLIPWEFWTLCIPVSFILCGLYFLLNIKKHLLCLYSNGTIMARSGDSSNMSLVLSNSDIINGRTHYTLHLQKLEHYRIYISKMSPSAHAINVM